MIIGLNAYIGSGKDTVVKIIQYLLDKKNHFNEPNKLTYEQWDLKSESNRAEWSGWENKKFAYKLKQIASILTGISQEKFEDQEFKKQPLDRNWTYPIQIYGEERWVEMTVRTFLQKLGTDAIRDNLHPSTWINAFWIDYKANWKERELYPGSFCSPTIYERSNYPNWLISDTRFPNEAESIKKRDGLVIRINRNQPEVLYQTLEQRHPSETSLDTYPFDYIIENNGTIDDLIEQVKIFLIKFNILNDT